MLTCHEITELCTDFEEGRLSTLAWAQFRFHLLMCGPCMEYVRQMRMTAEALAQLPTPEDVPVEDREKLSALFKAWHDDR